MSAKMHTAVKWESSTEEDDTSDTTYRMKLRDSLRNPHPEPVESSTVENGVTEPRRRGRGPSKRPCLNRNALMARENRQRKKAYLEKIENKLSFYQQENRTLVNTIRKQGIDIKRLSGEVAYLRSVLSNNTSIAALLKSINEGLRKMGACKKNLYQANNICHTYTDDLEEPKKCTCYADSKETLPKSANSNIYINSSVDHFAEYSANMENTNFYIKNDPDIKEGGSMGTTVSSLSQESEDSYTDNVKEFDNILPITQGNLPNTEEKKDADTLGADMDLLPPFNMDIFEDLPKCDDMISTIDGLHDSTSLFTEEDMFPSLNNTGICLHVNSDKVSLEFCSLCHSNSKGTGLN